MMRLFIYILHMLIDVLFFFFFILQHKDAYQVILDGVKGGPKEKRLAAQFIPKFFSSFPELADAAINAQLDLCEDEDVSVSIKRHRCPFKFTKVKIAGSVYSLVDVEFPLLTVWIHSPSYSIITTLFVCMCLCPDSTAGHQGAPAVCNWREHPQSCRYSHPAPSDRYWMPQAKHLRDLNIPLAY